MTAEEHNKYLAYSHFAYGVLTLLFTFGFLAIFSVMIFTIPNTPAAQGPPPPPDAFFAMFLIFFGLIYVGITVPSFVAGYALIKHKSWARVASIIAGVLAGMVFPIGTAVCVYTLWFLMSEPGKLLYGTPTNSLPAPLFDQVSIDQSEFRKDAPFTRPDWR